jgi:hypothetical protein
MYALHWISVSADNLNLDVHPFSGPGRYTAPNFHILLIHLLRIRQREFEPTDPCCQKTSELCLCEALPDAASRPMQERQEGVVAARSSACGFAIGTTFSIC